MINWALLDLSYSAVNLPQHELATHSVHNYVMKNHKMQLGTNNNNRTYIASKQTFQIAMTTQKIYGHSTSEVRKPESF